MNKLVAMAAVAAGMAVSAASAHASSFDFTRNDCKTKTENCFSFTNCETTVKVTSDPRCSEVSWSYDGLGVVSGRHDSQEINYHETLWLTFCDPISIKCLTFGDVGKNDSYKLIDANGCKLASGEIPGGDRCDTGIGSVRLDCLGPITKIGLTGLSCNDEFTLRSLETCEPCKPCAVPLPAAAWSGMGMLGLLGVGSMRKKIRRALTA